MKISNFKLKILVFLLSISLMSSCDRNALTSEQNIDDIEVLENQSNEIDNEKDEEENNGDNANESSHQENNQDDNNSFNTDNETQETNEEETPSETSPIDCSIFDGIFQHQTNFAIVKTLSIHDIDSNSVIWTIDGVEVKPRTPRILYIPDHIKTTKTIDVCYSAFSQDCGKLEGCITIDVK